jgi:integrase
LSSPSQLYQPARSHPICTNQDHTVDGGASIVTAIVPPRLPPGSAEITFDDFAELFLSRHTGAPSTIATLRDRLTPAREHFGDWKLSELEHASADIAAWRRSIPEGSRFRLTSALRQCLAAAVRWQFLVRNPAIDAGPNPRPRMEEIEPFTREQVDMIAAELGVTYGPMVVFISETGLRTNEWIGLERCDVDRDSATGAVVVQRRYAKGRLVAYPKTVRSRRRIPLTSRAIDAIEQLPPRIDTPLLFPSAGGQHINLDNWRTRDWYPALSAAGISRRGPYCLRHTFAAEALAAGISTFELSRVMGHIATDAGDDVRALHPRYRGQHQVATGDEIGSSGRQLGVRPRLTGRLRPPESPVFTGDS